MLGQAFGLYNMISLSALEVLCLILLKAETVLEWLMLRCMFILGCAAARCSTESSFLEAAMHSIVMILDLIGQCTAHWWNKHHFLWTESAQYLFYIFYRPLPVMHWTSLLITGMD